MRISSMPTPVTTAGCGTRERVGTTCRQSIGHSECRTFRRLSIGKGTFSFIGTFGPELNPRSGDPRLSGEPDCCDQTQRSETGKRRLPESRVLLEHLGTDEEEREVCEEVARAACEGDEVRG